MDTMSSVLPVLGFLWLIVVHAIAFAAVAWVAIEAWERYERGRERLHP